MRTQFGLARVGWIGKFSSKVHTTVQKPVAEQIRFRSHRPDG